jgi:hypothetical protein
MTPPDDDFSDQFNVYQFGGTRRRERQPLPQHVEVEDFYAYMPQHKYIFIPTRQLWPGSSVNARLGNIGNMRAAAWLDENRPVDQMTWAPGEPELLRDRVVAEGGFIDKPGVACFNLYREPIVGKGDPKLAQFWIDHVRKVYPDAADHIIKCFAQRVQAPYVKINHGIILGGMPGIGKDSLIEPLKHAVGRSNFHEVTPTLILGRFNPFLRASVLRVSEAHDLGEINRYQFYDRLKVITASPPDTLRIDEKNLAEYYIVNVVFVILTTNYKTDGVYLPAEDRRNYVAWSDATREDFDDDYWNRLWRRYDDGGLDDVAAYLRELDISEFDPKAPPPKTPAFWGIVNAQRPSEESELADLLDSMGRPTAVTVKQMITRAAGSELGEWLRDRKNRRLIGHRMEKCEYERLDNDTAKDGFWKIGGERQVVYARRDVQLYERFKAAQRL